MEEENVEEPCTFTREPKKSKYVDDMTTYLAWQNQCLMQYSWTIFQMATMMSFQQSSMMINNQYTTFLQQQQQQQQIQQTSSQANNEQTPVQPQRNREGIFILNICDGNL